MDEKKLPPLDRLRARFEGWWRKQSDADQMKWLAGLILLGVVCLALGVQLTS